MTIPYHKLLSRQSSHVVLQNLYNLSEDAINVYLTAFEKVKDDSLKCDFMLMAHRRKLCLEKILKVANKLNLNDLEKKPFSDYFINHVFTATTLTVPQLRDEKILDEALAFERDVEMACKLMPTIALEAEVRQVIEEVIDRISATQKILTHNLSVLRSTQQKIAV